MALFINQVRISKENIEIIWNGIKDKIPDHLHDQAKIYLRDWILAPSTRDIIEQEQHGEKPLHYAFEKSFSDELHLALAIKGHTLAAPKLLHEELFSFYVLEQFDRFKSIVLEALNEAVGQHFAMQSALRSPLETRRDADFLDRHWYGPVANLEWIKGWDTVIKNIQSGDPLEQMYKIISMICQYNWPQKLGDKTVFYRLGPTPLRDEFSASKTTMRIDAWTLNENHPQIISDREKNVPIWGGTSGTTMDIIHSAKVLGINDPVQLTALAYVIAAFFHFAPTKYVVHTFHEVMRGAKLIAPEIHYDIKDISPPSRQLLDDLFAASALKEEESDTQSPDSMSSGYLSSDTDEYQGPRRR